MRDSYRCPLFFPVFLRPAGIARAEAQAGLLLQAVDEGRGAEGRPRAVAWRSTGRSAEASALPRYSRQVAGVQQAAQVVENSGDKLQISGIIRKAAE